MKSENFDGPTIFQIDFFDSEILIFSFWNSFKMIVALFLALYIIGRVNQLYLINQGGLKRSQIRDNLPEPKLMELIIELTVGKIQPRTTVTSNKNLWLKLVQGGL